MRRIKRALSLTKSPKIEESISEVAENLEDTHISSQDERAAETKRCLANNNSKSKL